MLLQELMEASVPPSEYGYWIDTMGAIYPVGDHGHESFVRQQGFNSPTAMRRGWIRVTVVKAFQVEAMFTQVLPMAKIKLMQLAKASDATMYIVDNHNYDGGYESKIFQTMIAFQHGVDAFMSEDV